MVCGYHLQRTAWTEKKKEDPRKKKKKVQQLLERRGPVTQGTRQCPVRGSEVTIEGPGR